MKSLTQQSTTLKLTLLVLGSIMLLGSSCGSCSKLPEGNTEVKSNENQNTNVPSTVPDGANVNGNNGSNTTNTSEEKTLNVVRDRTEPWPEPTFEGKVYTNTKLGFEVTIPKHWTVEEEKNVPGLINFFDTTEKYEENYYKIGIEKRSLGDEKDLEAWILNPKKMYPGAPSLEYQSIEINGVKGYQMYSLGGPNGDYNIDGDLLLEREGIIYYVRNSLGNHDFPTKEQLELFESIVGTFKMINQ